MEIICVLVIVTIVLLIVRKKRRVKADVLCHEGRFRIRGNKEFFTVSKNDRFEFLVKNGQIVAVIDRKHGMHPIYYGGGK